MYVMVQEIFGTVTPVMTATLEAAVNRTLRYHIPTVLLAPPSEPFWYSLTLPQSCRSLQAPQMPRSDDLVTMVIGGNLPIGHGAAV